MKTAKSLVLFVIVCLICIPGAFGQSEVLTVQGNLPRLNYRDQQGNLTWALPSNGVLWKLDGPVHAGVVVITAAAPSNSITMNEGGVGIRGTGFPEAKLHVGTINSQAQPGEVKIDPGNPNASGSILVQNQLIDSEIRLSTLNAAKQSAFRLVTPSGHFSTSVGSTGNYVIRDVRNAVSPLVIVAGNQNNNALVIRQGRIGVGVLNPTSPIHVANGATCSVGGVWVNASSRELKKDIQELPADEATRTMQTLKPVTYAYKSAPDDRQVGFIAEDVPELVATEDRKGLSPMDVVAVLTKVVQEQQKTMEQQQEQLKQQAELLAEIQRELHALKQK